MREGDWQRGSGPEHLRDRRCEITGPVERKMMINALNSGARVFMADFEDANSPTWANFMEGQVKLLRRRPPHHRARDAASRSYRLNERDGGAARPAARLAPAGEARRSSTGSPSRRSLFDFGLYLFWNGTGAARARAAARTSTCPSSRATSRRACGTTSSAPRRTRSASRAARSRRPCSIETILAAFEMDEILYELREHSAGLNAGRWDYIFSVIKKFRDRDGLRASRPGRRWP